MCATDLGTHAHYLIYHAVYLARQCGATVEVVHAVEPISSFARAVLTTYTGGDGSESHQTVDAILANIKDRVVDSLAEDFMSGESDLDTICNVVIHQGPAADVIVNHAQHTNAGLIVMGCQSTRAEGVALLGSVAAKVLQLSTIPVLTIPLAYKVKPSLQEEGEQYKLW